MDAFMDLSGFDEGKEYIEFGLDKFHFPELTPDEKQMLDCLQSALDEYDLSFLDASQIQYLVPVGDKLTYCNRIFHAMVRLVSYQRKTLGVTPTLPEYLSDPDAAYKCRNLLEEFHSGFIHNSQFTRLQAAFTELHRLLFVAGLRLPKADRVAAAATALRETVFAKRRAQPLEKDESQRRKLYKDGPFEALKGKTAPSGSYWYRVLHKHTGEVLEPLYSHVDDLTCKTLDDETYWWNPRVPQNKFVTLNMRTTPGSIVGLRQITPLHHSMSRNAQQNRRQFIAEKVKGTKDVPQWWLP